MPGTRILLKKLPRIAVILLIVAGIFFIINYFEYIAGYLWTIIAFTCLISPFVFSLYKPKYPFSITASFGALWSGLILFTLGIWGYINLASFVEPIVCPIGYSDIKHIVYSYACSDGDCYDIVFKCSGVLGEYELDNFTVIFTCIILYGVYSIAVQPLCWFIQNNIMKISIIEEIKNKTIKVIVNVLSYVFIFLLLIFIITKEYYPKDQIINYLNKIIYPGHAVSLVEATRRSKIDLILDILEKGGDINAKNPQGESALNTAQLIENTRVMELYSEVLRNKNPEKYDLLEMGILFTKDSFLEQIRKGNLEAVKLFVNSDMQINPLEYDYDYIPLKEAVEYGYYEITNLLIEHGANVNAKETYSEQRPLICIAADNGFYEITELLIESGADINAVDYDNFTALMYSAMHGNIDITALLIRNGADLNITSYYGNTAVLLAAMNSDNSRYRTEENHYYQTIKCFVASERFVDFNIQNNDGWTCLMYASKYGNKPLVEYLLEHGAEPNAYLYGADSEGNTALRMANFKGYKEIAELLIKAGAVD